MTAHVRGHFRMLLFRRARFSKRPKHEKRREEGFSQSIRKKDYPVQLCLSEDLMCVYLRAAAGLFVVVLYSYFIHVKDSAYLYI